MKFYYLNKLIHHYLTSTFIDVLHSPFVFDLYQTAIRSQKDEAKFIAIENCRNSLLTNNQIINYTDLGAGSNMLSNATQKVVKQIAKTHLKPAKIAAIIHRIVLKYKHKNVVELGTSLGITTSYIASALAANYNSSVVKFTTLEGVADVKQIANEQFKKLKLDNYIHSIEGNFNTKLDEVLKQYNELDVFFVDGNHTYEATMEYFKKALPLANNNSVFIFDDIYWSEGMTKAWEEIKASEKVKQTVDLFFIGLVFFRAEQTEQHFKLRIF
ncbi:MAG: class I SAM-dependent methyltransferase [Bacteroidota bacterium]